MISNNYIIKTKGNKSLDIRTLQGVIKKDISKWGKEVNVKIFEPVEIQTSFPKLRPLNIARINYNDGFDSVLVTKVNKSNVGYSNNLTLHSIIPCYLIEVGVLRFSEAYLPVLSINSSIYKRLAQYKELAEKIKQKVLGIELLVFV